MLSDTAKAKQAVITHLQTNGQATTSELNEVIRVVLGEGYTEGKAAGAIRMCVADHRSHVTKHGRGIYVYQPEAIIAPMTPIALTAPPQDEMARIDAITREAVAMAKAHIDNSLCISELSPTGFERARQVIGRLDDILQA